MKRFLYISLLTAFYSCFSLFAENIQVTIADRDLEIPLEGVYLVLVGSQQEYYTDNNGQTFIKIPDDMQRAVLLASLPGYENIRLPFDPNLKTLEFQMILSGIIEGEELVVERTVPGETDEETGVSVVMSSEEMETTAQIGIVEDVMSAIKTLPGVGYAGGFDAMPSIRGGYPDELASAMDGFYVTYPYHWGGGYSIYNPNMVETAKLSHGIFSAEYGRAMSGLLEITTKNVDLPEPSFDFSVSTISTDLFIQTPIGEHSGLFLGGKVTYLDLMKFVFPEETEPIKQMPYIRDLYVKWQYKPVPNLDIQWNAFYGVDGMSVDPEMEDDGITMDMIFNYIYENMFTSMNVSWLASEKMILRGLGGYNLNKTILDFEADYSGGREYSDSFIAQFDGTSIDNDGIVNGLINGQSSYSIDALGFEGNQEMNLHQVQGKAALDYLYSEDDILTFGAEEVYLFTTQKSEMAGIMDIETSPGTYELLPLNFKMDVEGNRSLNSSVFGIWEYGNDQSLIRGEVGIRAEHFYLWNNGVNLNTVPVVNPRLNLIWTPLRETDKLESLSLSLGTGLFSNFSLSTNLAEDKYGLDDITLRPDRAFFNVIGFDALFHGGWKFQAEAYGKYYLNRLIISADIVNGEEDYYASTGGEGYTAGFDFMLQKKTSRYWDGYLTYTFIYARFKNPSSSDSDNEFLFNPQGEPMDEWYYPYYHRFHTLNLVLNIKPVKNFTFTISGSLASGAPQTEGEDITAYAAAYEGNLIERYSRSESYSDNLRDGVSMPVDLRFAWSDYFNDSKMKWEYYLGVEDIFSFLYTPSGASSFDEFTGEERADEESADFNLGIPVISFGYKLSY